MHTVCYETNLHIHILKLIIVETAAPAAAPPLQFGRPLPPEFPAINLFDVLYHIIVYYIILDCTISYYITLTWCCRTAAIMSAELRGSGRREDVFSAAHRIAMNPAVKNLSPPPNSCRQAVLCFPVLVSVFSHLEKS